MAVLSVIMPVYNEQATLEEVVNQVQALRLPAGIGLELIVVDDGSQDASPEIIARLQQAYPSLIALRNEKNLGKTQAVRKGILASTGDWVVVQDADFEYQPQEILLLLEKLRTENLDVVYGNRFGLRNEVIYYKNYWGNRLLSAFSSMFTYPRIGVWIPDMEVCYKLMKGEIARDISRVITATSNFGLEPEITARLARYKIESKHLHFGILPIHYTPRTVAAGKKLKAFGDGFKALREVIHYNLF